MNGYTWGLDGGTKEIESWLEMNVLCIGDQGY